MINISCVYAQDSLTTKQKDLLYVLQNYRKPNVGLDSIKRLHIKKYGSDNDFIMNNVPIKYHQNLYRNFTIKDYENAIIKREFLSILSPDYTNDELEALQKKYPKNNWYIRGHKNYQLLKIDKYNIQLAGWIYFKEAIPILIEGLKYPEQYDSYSVKIALARMQIEPYYSQMVANIIAQVKLGNLDITSTMFYIGTQEAVQKLEELLYIKTKIQYSQTYDYAPYNVELCNIVYVFIKDALIKDEYMIKNNDRFVRGMSKFNQEDLQYIQQYFKKNKGKIQFNKYWYREK